LRFCQVETDAHSVFPFPTLFQHLHPHFLEMFFYFSFTLVCGTATDFRTHMEELKEKTSDVLYENYRSDKLMSMGVEQDQTVFKEVKYFPLPPPCFPVAIGKANFLLVQR
jgi:Septin